MRILMISLAVLIVMPLKGQNKINEFEELANGYFNQGKLMEAAEFYGKAGYGYWNQGNYAQAASTFQKAYNILSKQGNITATIAIGNNLGLIYFSSEKYNDAYNAFTNVLLFARKTKKNNEILDALLNVGMVAFELSSYHEVISKATDALNIATESNNLKSMAKCYSLLAESYQKIDDATNAYKYFELYSAIDKKIKKQEMDDVKQTSAEEINKAHENKRITEIELKIKKGELKLTQDSLGVAERLAYERQMQVELRNEQLKKKEIQLRYELHLRRTLILGIIITALFLIILGFLLRQKLKDNKTLRLQKEEISEQRNKLDLQNKKITDSIHYGLRIQQAMLPDLTELQKKFEAFIIYRPKDIVSGDFYWFHEEKISGTTYQFIALVDCTGHGVPGAFMSMIGHRLLSETIIERQIFKPSQILEIINNSLRKELDQENKKSKDGMDMAFCRIAIKNAQYEELVFAGAKRPILLGKSNENKIISVEGDRKGIGGFIADDSKSFTDVTIKIQKGDLLILYSDGIIDQQNFERNRFGTNRFVTIINENINEPMYKMKAAIEQAFDLYAAPEEQRDDITVVGLRFS
jgi:serine phosphatase RsbU (regulator of sigma subunit)